MAAMTQFRKYNEHAAPALLSFDDHLERLGAVLVGIGGDDDHHGGYHLSVSRLLGTSHQSDYSLQGNVNKPPADLRAACAIDIGRGTWGYHGEWLEDVRRRCAADELPDVAELIGDPDLITGAAIDGVRAMYAAASTGWEWEIYTGQGHTSWCHVGVGRAHALDETLGDRLFAGWGPDGPEGEDEDMDGSTKFQVDRNGDGVKEEVTLDSLIGWSVGKTLEHDRAFQLLNKRFTGIENALLRLEQLLGGTGDPRTVRGG
ncbi:hypothetical protein [Cryptosporangium sp. NPDC051539]|uniref:hypothetical protein n=1 Tax=Cryptosporangium sp. NPDC051539 TaxID=3363962 RepID=UPI0037BBD390